jgi:hypothetical protein
VFTESSKDGKVAFDATEISKVLGNDLKKNTTSLASTFHACDTKIWNSMSTLFDALTRQ